MSDEPMAPVEDLTMKAALEAAGLEKQHQDGAGWFFWIAGLSMVNSAIVLAGSDWSFLIGLGFTQIIDGIALAIAEESGGQGKAVLTVIAFLLDAMVAASFVIWGVLARKGFRWAYLVGMVIYAFDGLIFLLVMDFLSMGFHVFALYCLWKGFKACGQLKRLSALVTTVDQEAGLVGSAPPPPVPPPVA